MTRASAALKEWLDAISGDEKFLLVVGCGGMSSLHLALHQITESTWLAVVTLTVGAYLGGKAVESAMTTNADARVAVAKTEAMAAVSPPTDPRAAAAALNTAVPTLQPAP